MLLRGRFFAPLLALTATVLFQSAAVACTTPVYRYAMYRWQPSPYEVYYFHDKPAGEEHTKVNELIEELRDAQPQRTNIQLYDVDVVKDKQLKTVPPDIRKAFQAKKNPKLPLYLVYTPGHRNCPPMEIYSGDLTTEDVQAMAISPARKKIAEQLAAVRLGVVVLLESDDKAASDKAEAEMRKMMKRVADGKVTLYTPPKAPLSPAAEKARQEKEEELKPEGGFVRVSRDDPQERWLVRMLLGVESDLPTLKEPMIFMAYGRGRVLLPYVGKGIRADNVVEDVLFISGACSCTVKEQNPGMDLLMTYDWEAASAAMAKKVGAEEGNRQDTPDLFPALVPAVPEKKEEK